MKNFDQNMIVSNELGKDDIKFYNVKEAPFKIYGMYQKEVGKPFSRMDLDVSKKVSDGVFQTASCTAGGRIRFKTSSPYVAVRLRFDGETARWPQMSGAATNGLDLYENVDGYEEFRGLFIPPLDKRDNYEQIIEFSNDGMHDLTLNMPIYGKIDELYIGIKEDACLLEGRSYKNELPIVFYGSSITQGGCMSRPGMNYENILSRKYNIDFLNLGFAGNAKGEEEIAKYIANLKMSMFVYDYDFNAPDKEYLEKTHEKMFKIIREKNQNLPIIIMSGVSGKDYNNRVLRRDVIKKTYDNAVSSGDKNVYFIDGLNVFKKYGYGWGEPTLEGVHPTDLGFSLIAKAIGEVFEDNKLI